MNTVADGDILLYDFTFNEINPGRDAIERFMGYRRGAPQPLPQMIDDALHSAPPLCSVRGGFFLGGALTVDTTANVFTVNGNSFAAGPQIAPKLACASRAALFIATAGPAISTLSREQMDRGEMLEGYILDAIGSKTVERAINAMQADLAVRMNRQGETITNRYSPGYCGWPVADQPALFSFFPPAFCGVTLTPSYLMNPIKSVSGVIGIGAQAHKKPYACATCTEENCFRKKLLKAGNQG